MATQILTWKTPWPLFWKLIFWILGSDKESPEDENPNYEANELTLTEKVFQADENLKEELSKIDEKLKVKVGDILAGYIGWFQDDFFFSKG